MVSILALSAHAAMAKLRRFFLLVLCLVAASTPTTSAAEPDPPWIISHRGLLRYAPENTLPNFRACLELRLGFEFDVRQTKDGHLVSIHDKTVDRTTNGTGKVSELTLTKIRELDAGGWFDPQFAGLKVPTVEEVLKLVAEYRNLDVLIRADIKSENVEKDVVRLAKKYKVLDQLLFLRKNISEPKIFKASPKAHVAVSSNNEEEFCKAVADAKADWMKVRFLPSKEQVETAHQAGKNVFISGPPVSGKLPKNWQKAADLGVDALLTDYPLELRALFRQVRENE